MKRGYVAAALAVALAGSALAQAGQADQPRGSQAASRSGTVRTQAGTAAAQIPRRDWTPPAAASGSWLGRRGHAAGPAFGSANPCSSGGVSPLVPSAMGCLDPRFTSQFFFPGGGNHGAVNLQPDRFFNSPVFVPYTYGYPVVMEAQPAQPAAEEAEPPAPTIFERRAQAAPVRTAAPSAQIESSPAASTEPAGKTEHVPTVLIFRDGHEVEVMNYAIVGQTLYDLGNFVAQKIPLSELNLKATVKANEERGLEFSVPASVSR